MHWRSDNIKMNLEAPWWRWMSRKQKETIFLLDIPFYWIHFEITGYPCNLIGSQWCNLFTNRTIFRSKSHLFLSQWEWDSKTKQPIRFQGSFKVINKISGKRKAKSHCVENFATAIAKTLLLLFSPKIVRFQNGSNKVANELRVVQFGSEILLVINRTRARRSFDFEITRIVSDQIGLHSVLLPLSIPCHSGKGNAANQSAGKHVVCSTVLHPTFPSCTTHMSNWYLAIALSYTEKKQVTREIFNTWWLVPRETGKRWETSLFHKGSVIGWVVM